MAIYGGITKKGRLSRNSEDRVFLKTMLIVEKLVRFDLAKAQGRALLSDHDIAKILHRSIRTLDVIRNKSYYLKKRIELTTGISTDSSESVEISISRQKQMLKLLMPDALRTLADEIQTKATTLAEKKFKTTVALEILDREGSFPKISRSDSHVKVEHNYNEMDGISAALLDSFEGPIQPSAADRAIDKVLEVNQAFSNSETLSVAEQELALRELEKARVTGLVN
jgi:hypothetical protein